MFKNHNNLQAKKELKDIKYKIVRYENFIGYDYVFENDKNYNADDEVNKCIQEISDNESFSDKQLSSFRLAYTHDEVYYSGNYGDKNFIVANLNITFITKSKFLKDKSYITHSIPIGNCDDNDKLLFDYNSMNGKNGCLGDDSRWNTFNKMYADISDKSEKELSHVYKWFYHRHSESVMVCYLLSKTGKRFLIDAFIRKGLLIKKLDGSHVSNIYELKEVVFDMHSTSIVCTDCTTFLNNAKSHLLSVFVDILQPHKINKQVSDMIDFRISSNFTINTTNVARKNPLLSTIAPHIPVRSIGNNISQAAEGKGENKKNILTNTEGRIKKNQVRLQKTGELSNRIYFISGSMDELGYYAKKKINEDRESHLLYKKSKVTRIQLWYREMRKYFLDRLKRKLDIKNQILSRTYEKLLVSKFRIDLFSAIERAILPIEKLYNKAVTDCGYNHPAESLPYNENEKEAFMEKFLNSLLGLKEEVLQDIKFQEDSIASSSIKIQDFKYKIKRFEDTSGSIEKSMSSLSISE